MAAFITTASVGDGVTENVTTLAAEIASLGAAGGTIWFPPGDYQCSNLSVPSNITLRGSHSNTLGASVCTRLKALLNSNNPVLSIKGTSTSARVFNVSLIDIGLFGDNHFPVIDTAYTSYLKFNRLAVSNTGAAGIQLVENWDSRITSCDFTFVGSADGTIGGINCTNGATNNTNSLVIENCRFESFPGTAIKASGSNCNKLYLQNNKLESGTSRVPFIDLNGVTHVGLINQQMTLGGGVGSVTPGLLSIVNCFGVFGHVSFERTGGTIAFTNYMTLTNSPCIDLQILIISAPPEPTSGALVNWDGLHAENTKLRCQSTLKSPVTAFPFAAYSYTGSVVE
jgi:hypothetical protein